MMWIGLTGGYGSGKTTVAKLLKQRGFTVVDADVLARLALGPGSSGLTQVLRHFGSDLLLPTGELDRKRLAEIVFNDRVQLEALERIVHPEVRRLADLERQRLVAAGLRVAFYDVPLLFEKKMESLFNKIVVVDCNPEAQIARATQRDSVTREQAILRIKNQIPLSEKVKRANLVLVNDGSIEDLSSKVDKLIVELEN